VKRYRILLKSEKVFERTVFAEEYKLGGYERSRYFVFYNMVGEKRNEVYLIPIDSVIDIRIDDVEDN